MNKDTFFAIGYTEKDNVCFDADIEIKEENGLNAVFVKANATPNYFDSELAVKIKIDISDKNDGFMSVNKYCIYWCRPDFGKELCEVPHDTQLLLFKNCDGTFSAYLPVCGDTYKCILEGEEGGLYARIFSWFDKLSVCDTLAFVYGKGENPYTLVHDLTEYAVKLLGNYIKMREERPYPEIMEYLGWCSWDAFKIEVSEDKMIAKCKEFYDKDIPVKWAIFDDMWGDVKNFIGKKYYSDNEMSQLKGNSALDSFEACPVRFPKGLAHCISEMEKYGVQSAMWHPMTGYWKGVTKEGEIYNKYKHCLIEYDENGVTKYIPGITREKFFEFFDAYHSHLNACSAKFMKIDFQSSINKWYKGLAPVGEIARNLHEAMEESVQKHFKDGALINCMGMASENVWNRPHSSVSRCSADFLPENRDWFAKHILQCAYNSFYQGQLYWCDWDMWWTDDGQAIKNAVIRAISGGPIYVSDTAERSIASVLKPLCLYDGRILRCDIPAMPTKDCLTVNPKTSDEAFTLFTRCSENYIIASFNLNEINNPVSESIDLTKLDVAPAEDKYIIKEYFSGSHRIICKNCDYKFIDNLRNQDEFRLYTAVPVRDGFAFLGLCGKYIGVKAAENVTKDGFTLLECGDFEFYSEKAVSKVLVDGKICIIAKDGNVYKVKCADAKRSTSVKIIYC